MGTGIDPRLIGGAVAVLVTGFLVGFRMEQEVTLSTKTVLLDKDQVDVWRYVSNWDNFKKWYPGVEDFHEMNMQPNGIGKVLSEKINLPFAGEQTYHYVLTVWDPPMSFEMIDNCWLGLKLKVIVNRNPENTKQTRLTLHIIARQEAAGFQYVMYPFFKLMYDQKNRQALFNLRMLMQS